MVTSGRGSVTDSFYRAATSESGFDHGLLGYAGERDCALSVSPPERTAIAEAGVMVTARKFADLKTAPLGVEIAPLEPVEKSVRRIEGTEPAG